MVNRSSAIRAAAAIGGAVWAWSWYTMYLEIHRWKHVTRSFRFNPPPPIPGANIRPRPGLPLRALFVCSAAAPMVFVGTVIAGMIRTRMRVFATGGGARPTTPTP